MPDGIGALKECTHFRTTVCVLSLFDSFSFCRSSELFNDKAS